MLQDSEPTLRVERQAVRAEGPKPRGVAVVHRVDQGARPLGLGPLIEDVGIHVGEKESRLVPDPNRPFDEDEPIGHSLDPSVGGNQVVETRVDTQDGPGTCAGCLIRRPTGRGYHEGDQHTQSQSLHQAIVDPGPGRCQSPTSSLPGVRPLNPAA